MPTKTTRRDELQEAVADYVLEHGVGELSLRRVATALGTSTYSLVYWFDNRDALVGAALDTAEQRQFEMIVRWVEERGAIAPGELLRRYWRWSSSEDGAPYARLFFEVVGLAQGDPAVRDYLERAVQLWRNLLEGAFEATGAAPGDARREATLLSAGVTGLQVDLLTSGDVTRTAEVAEALAARLDDLGEIPLADWSRPLPVPEVSETKDRFMM